GHWVVGNGEGELVVVLGRWFGKKNRGKWGFKVLAGTGRGQGYRGDGVWGRKVVWVMMRLPGLTADSSGIALDFVILTLP
ncbi:hypothetical protein Tco_0497678, partial [Tanacetum coccineum]